LYLYIVKNLFSYYHVYKLKHPNPFKTILDLYIITWHTFTIKEAKIPSKELLGFESIKITLN